MWYYSHFHSLSGDYISLWWTAKGITTRTYGSIPSNIGHNNDCPIVRNFWCDFCFSYTLPKLQNSPAGSLYFGSVIVTHSLITAFRSMHSVPSGLFYELSKPPDALGIQSPKRLLEFIPLSSCGHPINLFSENECFYHSSGTKSHSVLWIQ